MGPVRKPNDTEILADPRKVWVTHKLAQHALKETLAAFDAAKIPALPVKGILLAHLLYADPSERPSHDVDLRVLARDLPRIRRLAEERGFPLDQNSLQLGALGFRVGTVLIEVEVTVGPPGLCGLRVEDMMARATRKKEPFGHPYLQIDLHDHVVLLCVNVFKDKLVFAHRWSLQDLERIVTLPEFDGVRFVERVSSAKVRSLVWLVADYLANEYGSSAWGHIRASLGASPPRPFYAALFRRFANARRETLPFRILVRAGSDDPSQQIFALATTAAGSARAFAMRR